MPNFVCVIRSLHLGSGGIKIAPPELTIIETFTGPDICLLKRMRRFGNKINRGKGPVRLFGKTNIDGVSAQAGRNRVIKIQRQIQGRDEGRTCWIINNILHLCLSVSVFCFLFLNAFGGLVIRFSSHYVGLCCCWSS